MSELSAVLKKSAAYALARAGVGLDLLFRRAGDGLGILMLHRIAPATPGVPAPPYNVTPDRFERQLRGLLDRGYQAWPLRRVLALHQNGQRVPPRTFVVTFDDAYGCVHKNAWPVLRKLQIPATVFVATAYLDQDEPFPFDAWALRYRDRVAVESYRPLRTSECREMMASGLVEIGAHTHTHGDFRQQPEAFRRDLLACVEVLRERFAIEQPTFAFPFGYGCRQWYGSAMIEAARRAGVMCALTTISELVRPESDPFDWGRFNVASSDTAAVLQAKLDGWYSIVWRTCRRLWPRAVRPTRGNESARASAEPSCRPPLNTQGGMKP
jgi:peptidoglycan/xylan/chitin deacetylase (PgdA/CDA1 family)